MADGFIVRRGGKAEEVLRTATPDINFVSKTQTQIVVTFKNNDAAEADVFYGLTSPLTTKVTLATNTTSSNITFSGLDADTQYTISAYAIVTDATLKKIKSQIVSTSITTDPFSPAVLSPQMWMDASDSSTITESSGSVSQWNNKGSLGNFTQGTSNRQPTTGASTLNGLNVLDFSADFFTAANTNEWKFLHDGTKYEMFSVVKFGTSANPSTIMNLFSNVTGTDQIGAAVSYVDSGANDRINHAVFVAVSGNAALFNNSAEDFYTANTFAILSVFTDPSNATAADRSEIRRNGGTAEKNSGASLTPSTSNPSNALRIGANGNASADFLTGAIAEIIVISGANVTSTNRTNIINYLSDKWGITI
jgi:hypothetical protein